MGGGHSLWEGCHDFYMQVYKAGGVAECGSVGLPRRGVGGYVTDFKKRNR
jgi:hypothetical protein